jgi:tRNA 5-methylaminomethyl-2-thiouridine biosynthesis bifunctional protein
MQAMLDALGLPPDYVQALGAGRVSALAGLASDLPAWYYPGGGALSPQQFTQALLAQAERPVTLRMNTRVKRLQRESDHWLLVGDDDQVLAQTPLLVIAAGASGLHLLPDQSWPLRVQRGQVTYLPGGTKGLLVPALPMAGAGYTVADGTGGVWCGATAQDDDPDPAVRESDHAHNLAQLMRLSQANIIAPPLHQLQGRVGWRLIAEDRLPLVGAPAQTAIEAGKRSDSARFIARQPGLLVSTALASRGICWAALSGQVLAALATGAPCPVESSLLDAIDPARFDARRARAQGA